MVVPESETGAGRKIWSDECKNLWHIAGPVILTGVFQFLIGFVTAASETRSFAVINSTGFSLYLYTAGYKR
jgi:hypothetical protein